MITQMSRIMTRMLLHVRRSGSREGRSKELDIQKCAVEANADEGVVPVSELEQDNNIQCHDCRCADCLHHMRKQHGPRCEDLAPVPNHFEDGAACCHE